MQKPNWYGSNAQPKHRNSQKQSKRDWLNFPPKQTLREVAPARTSAPKRNNYQIPQANKRLHEPPKNSQPKPPNPISTLHRFAKHPTKHNIRPTRTQSTSLASLLRPKPKLKPAPAGQFRHYLSETNNIFYQQSDQFIILNRLKTVRNILLPLIVLLLTSYWLIGRIQPFPSQNCPPHADCLVFATCRKGYIHREDEQGSRCVVDPAITKHANSIGEAILEQLSYDYGNGDCQDPPRDSPPVLRFRSILQQFQIVDPLLQQELSQYFQSTSVQSQHSFLFRYNTLYPLLKRHSLQCSFMLFSQTSNFRWVLVLGVVLGVGVWRGWWVWREWRKVKRVYRALRDWTLREGVIRVGQFKGMIEREVGRWDEELWRRVDEERCKEGEIVYFVQEEQLYWKEI